MTVLAAPSVPSTSARVVSRRPALILGAMASLVGFLGSWIPSYWGDEAASVLSATRSLPSLLSELSTVDGVHGVYYAFLHVWTSFFGTSELATRLPSALATGAMVAGTVVLARHFGGTRLAVIAGVVAMVLPRTTWMATEARSYAMGAAAAVWLTVALVTLLRRRPTTGWWVAYGVAAAASVYLFLYLGLLVAVHGAYVLLTQRETMRRWLAGAGVAALLAAPIVLIGYQQREQIDFLSRRNYTTAPNILIGQWFGSLPVALLCWSLILVAIGLMLRRWRDRRLGVLALVWLVLPTAALLVGSATVMPTYNVRYLTLSTPAAAILVALGINGLARLPRTSWRRIATASALTAALVALCIPVYLGQRTPWAKDSGSDLRQVAEFIQSNARPGDAVVFDQATKPSRDPRLALRLYPNSFEGLRDVALVTPFDETDGLWDRVRPLNESGVELADSREVWAVELASGSELPTDVSYLESHGYRLDSTTLIHRTTIYHLIRE